VQADAVFRGVAQDDEQSCFSSPISRLAMSLVWHFHAMGVFRPDELGITVPQNWPVHT